MLLRKPPDLLQLVLNDLEFAVAGDQVRILCLCERCCEAVGVGHLLCRFEYSRLADQFQVACAFLLRFDVQITWENWEFPRSRDFFFEMFDNYSGLNSQVSSWVFDPMYDSRCSTPIVNSCDLSRASAHLRTFPSLLFP